MSANHYDTLGVRPDASVDEIRVAYRELARRHHPDRAGASAGGADPSRMPAINRAWFVLSDPGRRAVYDAGLSTSSRGTTSATSSSRGASTYTPHVDVARLRLDDGPARFPWRFILALVTVATAGILVMGILGGDSEPTPIDRVVQVGSCVDVDLVVREAFEVDCAQHHAGVVKLLVPFDGVCPSGTEGFRDRQGMGQVCLES